MEVEWHEDDVLIDKELTSSLCTVVKGRKEVWSR